MEGIVSVIIPMFNSEQFIRQCIGSVLNQTYRFLEIIVIDDGSTDESIVICKELQQTDDRIKIVCQENKGISSARNCGLEAAKGEYIFFLDSDDAIHPNLIEEYVRQMRQDVRIKLAFCDHLQLGNLGMAEIANEILGEKIKTVGKVLEAAECEKWFHLHPRRNLSGIIGKMVRKELVESLRFNERLLIGEDTVFLYLICRKRPAMVYVPLRWYYYRVHSKSITHSYEMQKEGQAFRAFRIIRDNEKRRGHNHIAAYWQYRLILELADKYYGMKEKQQDMQDCKTLKKRAFKEIRHPLIKEFPARTRALLLCCFWNYRLYPLLIGGLRSSSVDEAEAWQV